MPFIETALFGDDNEEAILHFGSVRYRVVGNGNLVQTLIGLDDVVSQILTPLVLSTVSGREKVVLSNFKSQRTRLRLETTEINEWFNFNRVILFVKNIYSGYPQ